VYAEIQESMKESVMVGETELRRFCVDALTRVQVTKEDAQAVADHLISANLRGVDSHGVIRIPYYVEGITRGFVNVRGQIRVVKETSVSALLNGGNQLGIVVANRATQIAIEKATQSGIAIVGILELGHVGMMAYYTEKIAREKLIGLACVDGVAYVAPWGGAERVFGANPISYAFPTNDSTPIVFDASTSAAAVFKIRVMGRKGQEIPGDWALDKDGNPTTKPAEALDGILLPFGQHKGYAFSLLVELLTYPLLGGLPSRGVVSHPSTQGAMFIMALNPTLFRDYADYCNDIEKIVRTVKSTKPAKGFSQVVLPGEIENRTIRERLQAGIPIDENTWRELERIAKELKVKSPELKS
jgi:LDH2 family malate/lactate/ureidoglycolate dehydrogenase